MTIMTVDGHPFRYRDRAGDIGAIDQVFNRRDYEFTHIAQTLPLMAWLGRLTRQPLIIDAGAHIGCASVWFSHQFQQARIVAIEPEPENFALLTENTGELKNVTPVMGAISSYDGGGYLHDPDRDTWGYRVVSGEPKYYGIQRVEMYSMRSLLSIEPDAAPFIAKIDIEGGEAELFSSNCTWMGEFPLIIIELHDWMLAGKASSRNFLHAIAAYNFDVMLHGENLFCFNNDLLASP